MVQAHPVAFCIYPFILEIALLLDFGDVFFSVTDLLSAMEQLNSFTLMHNLNGTNNIRTIS